jgi:hypothetical protein
MLQCIGPARFTRYCCDATESHFYIARSDEDPALKLGRFNRVPAK